MAPLPKHAFADLAGRVWVLALNYGLAKRIEKELGVDFTNAHNGRCFQQLGQDDALFVAVLFAICEKQAEAEGVTPEQFAEGLAGDQIEAAGDALAECVKLFTRPAIRPVLDELYEKGREGRRFRFGGGGAGKRRSPWQCGS